MPSRIIFHHATVIPATPSLHFPDNEISSKLWYSLGKLVEISIRLNLHARSFKIQLLFITSHYIHEFNMCGIIHASASEGWRRNLNVCTRNNPWTLLSARLWIFHKQWTCLHHVKTAETMKGRMNGFELRTENFADPLFAICSLIQFQISIQRSIIHWRFPFHLR